MKIDMLTLGHVQTNTYFIHCPSGYIVIDPCIATPSDYTQVHDIVGDKQIVAILLTHGHFDHISGVDHLMQAETALYISRKDAPFLKDKQLNGSWMLNENLMIDSIPTIIDTQKLQIDGLEFTVIPTPGHTHGSVAFLCGNDCFCGDFIMDGSIGRTDLETGSMMSMRSSLIEFKKRFQNKDIMLYPGHGSPTSFKHELSVNPYLTSL